MDAKKKIGVDTAENEPSKMSKMTFYMARVVEPLAELVAGQPAAQQAAQPAARSWRSECDHFGGLVLGCIDSYDSESRRIFSDFSRSTRFSPLRTALNPKFQQKLAKLFSYFAEISQNFAIFRSNFAKFQRNFAGISPKFHRIC